MPVHETSRPIAVALALACLLAHAASARAQPAPPAKLLADGHRLALVPSPAFAHGKVAMIAGTATTDAQRFYVDNLEILQPIAVTVLTKDAHADIAIELGKHAWDKDVARRASTKGVISATLKTRTAGDLGIVVRTNDGVSHPFQLVVWAGDPVPAALPPIVVKRSLDGAAPPAKPAARNPKPDPTLPIAIGAAIVVALLALVARHRRSS